MAALKISALQRCWAGPDADAVVHYGKRRGAASGPCEPEQTHQNWRRNREKGSEASLQSQTGKSIPKWHTKSLGQP